MNTASWTERQAERGLSRQVSRKWTQINATKHKRKSAKERKRAQKGAKERFHIKIASNQVWNNEIWELPNKK